MNNMLYRLNIGDVIRVEWIFGGEHVFIWSGSSGNTQTLPSDISRAWVNNDLRYQPNMGIYDTPPRTYINSELRVGGNV